MPRTFDGRPPSLSRPDCRRRSRVSRQTMPVSVAVTLPPSAEHMGVARDLVAAGLRRFGLPTVYLAAVTSTA